MTTLRGPAAGGFPKFLNVGKVAGSARCEFRGNQVVSGDKEHLEATLRVEDGLDTPLPCLVKINPWYVGMNINRERLASKANEAAVVGKVAYLQRQRQSRQAQHRPLGRWPGPL